MRWWRIYLAAFPDLAHLPGEYLSIPSSCCAVSSLFRRGGGPDYAQVAALGRRLADAYICLHNWEAERSSVQHADL
ncbi:hypothetical protein H4R21_003520 [Coemansia helicoidea]|uniref:Uncharacterized protein n=1 Tax=Coemansia helicoidea TaxID=1286919 RepID=A0ACC1L2V4_9FUNG|nr:hypothetical protein H4R21_003520 [Coemansia helicoidea]